MTIELINHALLCSIEKSEQVGKYNFTNPQLKFMQEINY